MVNVEGSNVEGSSVEEGNVEGTCEPGFGPVADAFRQNFAERGEVGAACSVVSDGKLVVDLWGGHRERSRFRPSRSKPWERDTLVTMYSTTKGMAAATMAIAHSRGWFEPDEPVATYWPEFAQNGKESITVRQLLGHQAGLAVIETKITYEDLANFDQLGAILGAQKPGWKPGKQWGYHAQTLGWYISQLLSRIDPKGRRVGQFFAEEIANVLGEEFYIGLPESVSSERIAKAIPVNQLVQLRYIREIPTPVMKGMMNPRSATFKAFTNPKVIGKPSVVNKRKILDLELPSVNGTGTARAVASVYGDMATGGKRLGITAETLALLEAETTPGLDQIFGIESSFSFGFMKRFPLLPFGSSSRAYGHTGMGGSFGYADPDRGLGYCYAMNKGGYSVPVDGREGALRAALDSCSAAG